MFLFGTLYLCSVAKMKPVLFPAAFCHFKRVSVLGLSFHVKLPCSSARAPDHAGLWNEFEEGGIKPSGAEICFN